jgi:RHS repeat-associated protein
VTHTNNAFANESFTYDANGNETGTGYTTSTGNEQTASPGNTYSYDADGNTITDTITSTGDVWTYSYNYRGQMTGAVEKTSGGTVLAQVSSTYDALGNRIGMDENGTQTWTLYDGSDPIMDINSSGSLEMRYLNGPTGQLVDSVLARESSGGTVAWYLPDRLGTVRDLINNSGAIIDHIDFSAFGTVLDQSAPSEGDRMMGFAGMELDLITGMNLAVYRVQNPGTGRWTSQDPSGFAGGDADLYRYVGNDFTGETDTAGLAGDGSVQKPINVLLPVKFPKMDRSKWPQILACKETQLAIADLYKRYKAQSAPRDETALWVLWNETMGEVLITSEGTISRGPHGVTLVPPTNKPGFKPIGTIHTHSGSGSKGGLGPSRGDLEVPAGGTLYYGCAVHEDHYQFYYPWNFYNDPNWGWIPVGDG